MKKVMPQLPTFDAMMLPTLQALQILGGSGTTEEIYGKVVEILCLPNEVLDVPHGDTSQNEVEYRLAWSRTYLKKYGLIDNSARGVWALTSTANDFGSLDPKEIVKAVREADRAKATKPAASGTPVPPIDTEEEEALGWHKQLHKVLMTLPAAAF